MLFCKAISGQGKSKNTELTITAIAAEGYKVGSLTLNDETIESGDTHSVIADVTIAATFKATESINKNTLANITVYGNENNVCIINRSNIFLKSVQITDIMGRVVYTGSTAGSVTIPVNGTSGIYIVNLISDDNKTSSTKVHLTR